MKKILIALLNKYSSQISDEWSGKLEQLFSDKFSKSQIIEFVKKSLQIIQKIIESSDFK